jgi:dienelactone hydrolase
MSKLALAVFSALLSLSCAHAAESAASPTPKRGELIEIPAAPAKGFHFPYLLFIPESPAEKRYDYLLVEPNNTGRTSDDPEVHRAAAIGLARDSSVGNFVAKTLGVPLLVPVFPRASSTDDIYTHSLDRDTILITDGPLRRLDLQLLAMIADARPRLVSMGRAVNSKVLMNGFSASGLFANRFAFLHPETVAAAAFGGLNCFIMLPVAELKSHSLNFPLGTADLEKITGHAFDRTAYQAIPQFAYMGADDTNDAVVHDDAYSAEERALIFELLARAMPERWQAVQAVYANQKMPMQFKTYPGIGHGTNGKINNEVAEFFRGVIEKR